jgi:hypothetical protein
MTGGTIRARCAAEEIEAFSGDRSSSWFSTLILHMAINTLATIRGVCIPRNDEPCGRGECCARR